MTYHYPWYCNNSLVGRFRLSVVYLGIIGRKFYVVITEFQFHYIGNDLKLNLQTFPNVKLLFNSVKLPIKKLNITLPIVMLCPFFMSSVKYTGSNLK